MSLETIYYITQIIAVVTIIFSLAGIWYQLRQGQRIAKAEVSNVLRKNYMELTLRMVDDVELARAFRALTIKGEHIDNEDDLTRLIGWFMAFYTLWGDTIDAHEKGLVDEKFLLDVEFNYGFYLSFPVVWKATLSLVSQRQDWAVDYAPKVSEALEALREKGMKSRERNKPTSEELPVHGA